MGGGKGLGFQMRHMANAIQILTVALLLIGAGQVQAVTSLKIEFGEVGQTRQIWSDPNLEGTALSGGEWWFVGSRTLSMGVSEEIDVAWDFSTNADPFVDGVFAFTNNTSSTIQLMTTYSVNVVPSLAFATGGASVIGNLTVDSTGGTLGHIGASGSTPESMYTTLVDGSAFKTLLDFDSSVSLAFGSGSTAPASFGLPGLTTNVPGGVATSIGSRLAFTLTPGDSASFTSRFEVVPEPTTALLVATGLVGLGLSRKRLQR